MVRPLVLAVVLLALLVAPSVSVSDVARAGPASACSVSAGAYDWDEQGADWTGTCACGAQQSPINIDTDLVVQSQVEDISCPAGEGRTFEATIKYGTNVLVTPDTDYLLTSGGSLLVEKYKMLQYHFHAPSEHTIDEERFPLEVHYVHSSGYGQLAVVGYLFEKSSESVDFIADLANWLRKNGNIPEGSSDGVGETSMNMALPSDGEFYHYMGSLTTPPCTERVNWHLYKEPLQITQKDLDTIIKYMVPNNYRVVQEMHGRVVGLGGWDDPPHYDDDSESSAGRMGVGVGAVGAALAHAVKKMF